MVSIDQIEELIKKHTLQATKTTILDVQEVIVAGNYKLYNQINKLENTAKSLSTQLLQTEKDVKDLKDITNSNINDITIAKEDLADLHDEIKVLKSNLQQMSEENQLSALKLDDQIDQF